MNKFSMMALTAAAMSCLLPACERNDELDALGAQPSEGKRVEVCFAINMPEMTDPAASIPISSEAPDDPVIDSRLTHADQTRASGEGTPEGTEDERKLSGIWVLQFDGTDGTAKLAAKDYYEPEAFADGKLRASLLESGNTIRAYLVANVGQNFFLTTPLETTTIDAFQKMNLDFLPTASVPEEGLPMVGVFEGLTSTTQATVSLTRMVAKIAFTCNVDWNDLGGFKPTSVRLRSHTTNSAFVAPAVPSETTGLYPDANVVENFADAAADPETQTSFTRTWYLAENLRGVVSGLTAQTKGLVNAPTRSTYIEVVGDCTVDGETFQAVYRVYPGQNDASDFNIIRNYTYTLTSTIRGMNENDLRVAVNRAENLSAYGTANSYIVHKAGATYYFDATVMGNGATTPAFDAPEGGVDAPEIVPQSMTPASAKVLWETGAKAGEVIASVKLNNGGFVEFTTAGSIGDVAAEGNALIGVFDKAGTLLWSWHIWSTSYDPEINYDVYTNYESKNYDVMQFNLGADATSAEGEVGRFGLLYQWGRKDPFVGAASTTSPDGSEDRLTTTNDVAYKWANEAAPFDGPDMINLAIQHPTTFYHRSPLQSDWVTSNKQATIDNLWGNPNATETINPEIGAKSIYDPCPPGWRVAPQDTWTGLTTTGTEQSISSGNCNVDELFNFGWTAYVNGTKSGPTTFLPATGYYRGISGEFYGVGIYGNYWSSSSYTNSSSDRFVGALTFGSTNIYPTNPYARAAGLSVRCVRDVDAPGPGTQEIDLSAKATANSYIVNRAGAQYKFKATVMGNGATTPAFDAPDVEGAVDAPQITPTPLSPASVKVLWETNTQKSVIASVSLSDGYVHFTTAGTRGTTAAEGNAVIGVFDASGTLIWSWHIWSTEYDPDAKFDVYTNHAGKNYTVMQYNLGAAATAKPGEVGLFGLLYQWGRKDPFIGAKTTSSTGEDYADTWNEAGYDWINEESTHNGDEQITYAIQNPTKFLTQNKTLDWLSGETYSHRDNLWGNPNYTSDVNPEIGSKSIYDPCPPGWRVAPNDVWTGFTSTGLDATASEEYNVSGSFNVGWTFYVGGWKTGATNFYPMTTFRTYNAGILSKNSTGYWSSSASINSGSGGVGSRRLSFSNSLVGPQRNASRCHGFPIRCVKE